MKVLNMKVLGFAKTLILLGAFVVCSNSFALVTSLANVKVKSLYMYNESTIRLMVERSSDGALVSLFSQDVTVCAPRGIVYFDIKYSPDQAAELTGVGTMDYFKMLYAQAVTGYTANSNMTLSLTYDPTLSSPYCNVSGIALDQLGN